MLRIQLLRMHLRASNIGLISLRRRSNLSIEISIFLRKLKKLKNIFSIGQDETISELKTIRRTSAADPYSSNTVVIQIWVQVIWLIRIRFQMKVFDDQKYIRSPIRNTGAEPWILEDAIPEADPPAGWG